MKGLLARLGGGGMDPEQAIKMAFNFLPDHRKVAAAELASFLGIVREIGPPEPPTWAMGLFRRHGPPVHVSPELLAALSWVLVRWDPWGRPRRVGLVGLPPSWVDEPGELRAELQELVDGEPGAAARVDRAVEVAARELQERARAHGSMALAVQELVDATTDGQELVEPVARVATAQLVYVLRTMGQGSPGPEG